MMFLLIKLFVRDRENASLPGVKRAYASLSSMVGMILNLFLCTAKIMIGSVSHSVAITADGFNNLSDAGTSLVSLVGFRVARYGGGSIHPFGHGRIEWIMGIFTSVAVLFMGYTLAGTSVNGITHPEQPVFGTAVFAVLVLSILVKGYMYLYNRKFARLTDLETLKATAADCVSDLLATSAVLLSAIISHVTGWMIDGYCGVLVSVFIMIAGGKSLWEVLGRIMGKAADREMMEAIMEMAGRYREIDGVSSLMIHDYGFGYFVISIRVEGKRGDGDRLYGAAREISYEVYRKFRCECLIQIDYLLEDEELEHHLMEAAGMALERYGDEIMIEHFRLLDGGTCISPAFDMLYPPELQKSEEEMCRMAEEALKRECPGCHPVIRSVLRRDCFHYHFKFGKNLVDKVI